MIRILAPASSANIGPGFDCLGLALNLYDEFTVEKANETRLSGVEERFCNDDNLFLQAYRRGCAYAGREPHIHVRFAGGIPVSRGLGSSAALISAGLTAASFMQDRPLEKQVIFQLAAEMEGHPDNAAPCLFGGLSASASLPDGTFITRSLDLHPDWKFTVLIPDFEVSTEKARAILPEEYSRSTACRNTASAILTVKALADGDRDLLQKSARDAIHEPYRRKLISCFDELKAITEKDSGGVMLISGSGSTCLLISEHSLSRDAEKAIAALPEGNWQIRECEPALQGTEAFGEVS